ncbi:adenine deaminase C-terminal domain-containing protein [uncultured Ruegeria sp.]|uniref:adenine deaminase n=1 Tax=uncultured Ruegeria sp. TaxID=259304 RepID=UPI00262B2B67|nr:adenine deaminase C-terminal domain-containing protein [uncultured Ruegeria sp.]
MTTDANLNDPMLRANAVKAARGLQPFDMLVRNTMMLDMVTGRERPADIGIVDSLIASVHAPDPTRDAIEQLDAAGAYIVPGFIDTHLHVESSMVTPAEYARTVVPRGVTTAFWDPHELANVAGMEGVDYACCAAKGLPLRLLPLAPTCVPSAPGFETSGGDFGPGQIAKLLARDDVHGAAELMTMHQLLDGDRRVQGIVAAGLASGKRVCGHGRGLVGGDLAAYAAAGVETDHELTSAADLIARLETGLTIELRGSHEHLIPEFAKALIALGHLPQTVTLCTDDVFPDDLFAKGGLNHVIRMLIANDIPPAWAYRAATLNAASRVGRPDLGLVAPGKIADFVLLSDLRDVSATQVFASGQLVAQANALLEPPQDISVSPTISNTVQTQEFSAADFNIHAIGGSARITTLSKPRFPEWGTRDVEVKNGNLLLPDDMIRMAVCNRYGRGTPTRVAFLENWGTWRGAFATTVSHDSHNLTVFGRDPEDMTLAANAVRNMQGGLAVAAAGKVVAKLPLPIAGLISQKPLEDVAKEFADLRSKLDTLVDWQPPYLVFKALFGASLVCNAGPRLSDVGLVDVFDNRILESCVATEAIE